MNLRVSAILLAAGRSRRMGRPKQLLPLGGKPALVHSLDAIAGAGIEDVVVVLNALVGRAAKIIRHLPVNIVFNNDPASEMADSVRIGLSSVHASSSGVLVHLADYPLISADTVRALMAMHSDEPDKILIPAYEGAKGHPCLFPKHLAMEVFQGNTLKQIVHRDNARIRIVQVRDEGILLDMDTEEDYTAMLRLHSQKLARTFAP